MHIIFLGLNFFQLKRLRTGVWRTIDIGIGGKNPTNISFASIGNQVMFYDTIKYFQQSLAALANCLTDEVKKSIQKECIKFISRDESLLRKFKKCSEQGQEWIINYLSSGKGVFGLY